MPGLECMAELVAERWWIGNRDCSEAFPGNAWQKFLNLLQTTVAIPLAVHQRFGSIYFISPLHYVE